MSTVAKEANVTRGCMQYYFPTTESLLETAANQLVENLFGSLSHQTKASPSPYQLEQQLDMTLDAVHAPEFQILVELMAVARTETMLRPILARVMLAFDRQRVRLTNELFGDRRKAHQPRFRAASDLVILLAAGATIFVLPGNSSARLAALREPIKDQVFKMWDIPRKT